MHANVLLGSAKPGHTEPSHRSAVKKSGDGYRGDGVLIYWISLD